MENQKETVPSENQQNKKKQKKKGKIEQVVALHKKGTSIKDISEKMGISEKVVRSYLWRGQNPTKYKDLLARYYTKRKQKNLEKTDQPASNGKKSKVRKRRRKSFFIS